MNKNLGQVFTPEWVVDLMLESINYKGSTILNKRIIEPSAGDGAFLKKIVMKYIETALENNWSKEQIKEGLENNIFGIELDAEYYRLCIKNLDNLIQNYDIKNVNWQIKNEDALKNEEYIGSMDYVVGNPPYVRVHNLEEHTREYLKNNYIFCKNGTIDLYIAFYELGINMLKDKGVLSFITPNSFMYNASSKEFREFLLEKNLVSQLINFGSERIFNASTYSAILNLEKNKEITTFKYSEYKNNELVFIDNINLIDFSNKNWNFTSNDNIEFLNNVTHKDNRLENIANIQYGFATLRDKIYISKNIKDYNQHLILFNGHLIEKELLHPIVKGSTYNGGEIEERILFPYKRVDNKWEIILEEEMKEQYPNAYAYFLLYKEELLKRDMDKNYIVWYQFGRSQGISNISNEKLIVKHIINNNQGKVDTYNLDNDVFVYSGIFITGNSLGKIKETIESNAFFKYVLLTGKDLRGGYKTINTKMIKIFSLKPY